MPLRARSAQMRNPPQCEIHPLHSVGPTGCPMCNVKKSSSDYLGVNLVTPKPQSPSPEPGGNVQESSQEPGAARDTYFSQDATVGNWVSAQIQVTTDKGRSVKIKAKVMGYVAVHPPLPEDPERTPFVLSSSSTGLMIARVNTEIDAQRIGYFLMSKFTYAMSRKTQQDIVSKLPQWVLEWIRTCRKEKKYVEPQQPG